MAFWDFLKRRKSKSNNTERIKPLDNEELHPDSDFLYSQWEKSLSEKREPTKEEILVDRVTTEDMLKFSLLPYDMNCSIHKFKSPYGHPFAYMNLNQFNVEIAKMELEKINQYISQYIGTIPYLSEDVFIDINEIVFSEYSESYGYTRLMCTPSTFSGKASKYPLHLSFMTRMDIETYQAFGNLFYTRDGNIGKANVSIKDSDFWAFTFKSTGKSFYINKAMTSIKPDEYGNPGTVYSFEI